MFNCTSRFVVPTLFAALFLAGCKDGAKDVSAGKEKPATAEVKASDEPAKEDKADPASMNKGTKKLKNEKALGEQDKDTLKQLVVDLGGWDVKSAAESKSGDIRIATIAATNDAKESLRIDWYEYPNEESRASSLKSKENSEDSVLFVDGDYFMTIEFKKEDGSMDKSKAEEVMKKITG